MPADAVGGLAVDDGPGRGVQTGVAGQRAIVEVDGTLRGQRQDIVRDHTQVGDAEQPIGLRTRLQQITGGVQNGQAVAFGPAAHGGVLGDDSRQAVAPGQDHVAASDGEGFIPDQDGTEAFGIECGGHDFSSETGRCGNVGVWRAGRPRPKRMRSR